MKNLIRFAALAILCLAFNTKSNACVDFHPDSVIINILVDTVECNMILEISNLNMFGGNPNDFCSCGIHNAFPDAATILWVAFVDAETNEPLEGFDLYEFAGAAGDSWEDADPLSIDWSGLVSGVNEAGIVSGQDVKLWIIVDFDETDEQWSWLCDTNDEGSVLEGFGSWAFGTDEWDNEAQELANSHQSITYFSDQWEFMSVGWIDHDIYMSYIEALDNFYNGIEEFNALEINVYPNPASDFISIETNKKIDRVEIRDVLGKQVQAVFVDRKNLDVRTLPKGVYFLDIIIDGVSNTQRVVVSK